MDIVIRHPHPGTNRKAAGKSCPAGRLGDNKASVAFKRALAPTENSRRYCSLRLAASDRWASGINGHGRFKA